MGENNTRKIGSTQFMEIIAKSLIPPCIVLELILYDEIDLTNKHLIILFITMSIILCVVCLETFEKLKCEREWLVIAMTFRKQNRPVGLKMESISFGLRVRAFIAKITIVPILLLYIIIAYTSMNININITSCIITIMLLSIYLIFNEAWSFLLVANKLIEDIKKADALRNEINTIKKELEND